MPVKKLTLKAHKDALMKRARQIARAAECVGFEDVRRKFADRDALILKLWATADNRDEIERLCNEGQGERRSYGARHGQVDAGFKSEPEKKRSPRRR